MTTLSYCRCLLLVQLLLTQTTTKTTTTFAFIIKKNTPFVIISHPKNEQATSRLWSKNANSQTQQQQQQANNNNTPRIRKQKKNLKTFERYLEIQCWTYNEKSHYRSLEPVLRSISTACKQMNRIIQRAQTDDLYGVAAAAAVTEEDDDVDGGGGMTNVQGEVQQKLDVVCNEIMLRNFCGCSNCIRAVASEEEDLPRFCSDVMSDMAFDVGDYVAVFDPIDGSKNIDASLPVGTVFGIYQKSPDPNSEPFDSFLQKGDDAMVAAGYCLYSATTVLVLTMGSGVDGFTLDPDKGIFLHTHEDMRIPSSGPIYSFNEANFRDYSPTIQKYLDSLKMGSKAEDGKRYNARYIGALVADVHNILINGGIFGYPATRTHPNGKLRLLYECCPMSMIMEKAGGVGSTGMGRILDVMPKDIHERTPIFLGSKDDVFNLEQFFRYYSE